MIMKLLYPVHYMISHSEKIKLDDRLFSSVSVKAGP